MEILRGRYDEIQALPGRRVLTLGTFDGVHRGHQAIIAEVRSAARRRAETEAAAVTFATHPRAVLTPERSPRLLTTLEERLELLAATGLDRVVVLDFDARLAAIEHERFLAELLVDRLHMDHFVLGHDVHFGRGRGGNVVTVAEAADRLGFTLSQVPSLRDAGAPISSTRIRDLLAAGETALAVRLLGHPFPLRGRVQEGRRLGRRLGFPTANLCIDAPGKILPAEGVYAGWARWEGRAWVPAVANLGRAPTVAPGGPLRLEVHLPGRTVDLYQREVQVALGERLRGEETFPSLEALQARIQADLAAARRWIASAPPEARPARLENLRGPSAS